MWIAGQDVANESGAIVLHGQETGTRRTQLVLFPNRLFGRGIQKNTRAQRSRPARDSLRTHVGFAAFASGIPAENPRFYKC